MALIRKGPRDRHADCDLAKWLRARFHERDAEAYFRELVSDATGRADDVALLRDTVSELATRYPGRASAEIRRLLGHSRLREEGQQGEGEDGEASDHGGAPAGRDRS